MRGRKAAPINGIDQYDFDSLARIGGSPRERVRFLAFAHIQNGQSFSSAARMVRVRPRTVIVWVQRFRKKGLKGLLDKAGQGAKPYLSSDDYESFRQSVEELQKARQGGRIRGKDIADLMERLCKKRPSKSTVYLTLKKAGLVWITGRSQHPKADKAKQESFKKTLNIKF